MTDTIIIGGGPAGVSAALYILRAGFSVTIIAMDKGALQKAEKIENYYGLKNAASGEELFDIGINQAKNLGAEVLQKEVVGLSWDGNFKVLLSDSQLEAKSLIIASGAQRKKASVKGLTDFEGKGVSYCAVCDAPFYKNKVVGVLGCGEYALHEYNELIRTSKEVIVFTNGEKISTEFPENTKIVTDKLSEIYGDKIIRGVFLENGTKIDISGLFIALGTAGSSDLAQKLGVPTEKNRIITDENMETGIPGTFAAGDCTGGILQVAVAVSEGAKAGMSAIKYLRNI